MSEVGLDRLSVETLNGVGPALASKLHKLGLFSLQIYYFIWPFAI